MGILAALGLGVGLASFLYPGEPKLPDASEPEALKEALRDRVANGEMTMEEAQVALALATKEAQRENRKKGNRGKKNPKLEALGSELAVKVKSGNLTPAEAKQRWLETAGKTNRSGKKDGPKASKL